MNSVDHDVPALSDAARDRLLELTREAVRAATCGEGVTPPAPDTTEPDPLGEPGASFVTLKRAGRLRGCIGSLERRRRLAEDVCHNAHAAAIRDPRFPPLAPGEIAGMTCTVAVLTPPEALPVTDRSGLLETLRPHRDGLILHAAGRRATFLPAVWENLPDPEAFIAALLQKAGLPPDAWSDSLETWRYEALEIHGTL
ncbi:MAG: AmmeMemoRadiSam system protein A [Pseudomonadota bacterium]